MEVKQSVGSKETAWQAEAHLKFIIAIAVDYHSTKTGNQSSVYLNQGVWLVQPFG